MKDTERERGELGGDREKERERERQRTESDGQMGEIEREIEKLRSTRRGAATTLPFWPFGSLLGV